MTERPRAEDSAPAARRPHESYVTACLWCLFAVALAYSNHFGNGFHFDDNHVIVNNLAIRSLGSAGDFFVDPNTFSSRPQNATYRPLLSLSYALDYRMGGGLDPPTFHRTQFALLVVLGALLVVFFREVYARSAEHPWNRWIALFAATLFCIHTANTQTVNYLSARSSLVATLGVIGSFVVYLVWPRGRGSLLYLVPALIGGLAKPLTVMLAPLLGLFSLLFEQDASLPSLRRTEGLLKAGRALRRSLPAVIAGAALFLVVDRMNAPTLVYSNVDRWRYLASQPFVWLHYFRLFFYPRGLTADADWSFALDRPSLLAGIAFLAALAAMTVWLSVRRHLRPAAFGLGWFALALLPTSSVFPLSEVYNEHRLFFPFVGLALATSWVAAIGLRAAFSRFAAAPRIAVPAAAAMAIAVVAALGIGTFQRNRVWLDSESLWRDVVRKSPRNGRGLMNYGLSLMNRGRTEQALGLFERARELTPNYSVLEANMGIAESALGNAAAGEEHLRRALELEPGYARGHYFYARWLAEQGRGPEALRRLRESLRLSSRDADTRRMLMNFLAAIGDEAGLQEVVQRTLEMSPDDPVSVSYRRGRIPISADEETPRAYVHRALAFMDEKDWIRAALASRRAIQLDPDYTIGWNDLGWSLSSLGYYDLGLPCFREALRLDPKNELARNNLAWAERRAAETGGRVDLDGDPGLPRP